MQTVLLGRLLGERGEHTQEGEDEEEDSEMDGQQQGEPKTGNKGIQEFHCPADLVNSREWVRLLLLPPPIPSL